MRSAAYEYVLQPIMRAIRVHARMGLLALRMNKDFVANAVLITAERRANVGIVNTLLLTRSDE